MKKGKRTYSLKSETITRIEELAATSDRCFSNVIDKAITELYNRSKTTKAVTN